MIDDAKQWFKDEGYYFKYDSCIVDGKFHIDNEQGIQLCRNTKKKRFWWYEDVTEVLKYYHLSGDLSLWGGSSSCEPNEDWIIPINEKYLHQKLEVAVVKDLYKKYCKENKTKILKGSMKTTRYP